MRYLIAILVLATLQTPVELSAKRKKSKPAQTQVRAKPIPAPAPSQVVPEWQKELRAKIRDGLFPAWMQNQIKEDLEPFSEKGFTAEEVEGTMKEFQARGHADSLLLCKIVDNQFFCSPPIAEYDSRAHRFVSGITGLLKTVRVPDMQFIVYTSEAFLENDNQAPIFTWCKHTHKGKRAVNFPDYEALNGNYAFLKEVELGKALYPWHEKKNSAFWRGTLTGGWGELVDSMSLPRVKLAEVSYNFPHLVDAKLVGQIGDNDESELRKKTLAFKGEPLPISAHLQYKYQILVDGHVSAFSRFHWQLFSNCVIFKQTSPWYQWFYNQLRPYEHYIPYKSDASDLVGQIIWALQNDDKARQISENARKFAENNLKHADIMLYVYLLLSEYAKLQRS